MRTAAAVNRERVVAGIGLLAYALGSWGRGPRAASYSHGALNSCMQNACMETGALAESYSAILFYHELCAGNRNVTHWITITEGT